jgi:hypothetical protein
MSQKNIQNLCNKSCNNPMTKTYNNLATNFDSSIGWEKHTKNNLATNLGAIQWQNKIKINQSLQQSCIKSNDKIYAFHSVFCFTECNELLLFFFFCFFFVLLLQLFFLLHHHHFVTAFFAGWRCLIVKLQTALFWILQFLREQICMQECVFYLIVSSHDRDSSLPPSLLWRV